MNRLLRGASALIVSFTCLALPGLTQEAASANEAIAQRLDTYLSRLAPLGFSGAVLVMKDGEPLLEKGYGSADRARGLPMGPKIALPIGSISKHFTAAAVMRLLMDEELALDNTLGDFFDEVPEDKAGITIHQLLIHAAGFPESAGLVDNASTAEAFVRAVLRAELLFPPGADRSYSNLGFGLLAAIVERVAGEPFEEYLRRKVWLPAGMQDTGIRLPEWKSDQLAHGYIDGQDHSSLGVDVPGSPWHLLGAGGVRTTLADMARWEIAFRENTVLDAPTLELMTTAHASRDGFGAGYGCGVFRTPRGTKVVGHNGSNDIFGADWRRFVDEGVMIFAASNDADCYAMDVTPQLEALVFGADVPLPPETVELPADVLSAYGGTYELEGGAGVHIEVGAKRLVLSSADPAAAKLLHPVPAGQVARRNALLADLPAAYEQAFGGEFDALHELLDPFTPADEFAAMESRRSKSFASEHGAFESVWAVPGRNRFGEIAIIAVLEFERGNVKVEFSFGDREVGSVRLIDAFPTRVLYPASRERFVDFDPQTGASSAVQFELGENGEPQVLLLAPLTGGASARATRKE